MTRFVFFFSFIFIAATLQVNAQKSKVLATFHLIEDEKYKEAKEAIEEAIEEESTKFWPRTWYARGYLAQTAYEKGKEENDKKKYQLYSDQLYVAYESYEKALNLDSRKRFNDQLAPMYVLLANDFQKLGEQHYKNGNFKEAFRAFSQAIKITESNIVTAEPDPNLIYNAALSAYKSENWEKAIEYFNILNKEKYSARIPHLLSSIYLEQADSVSAREVLARGIEDYEKNEQIVLLLAELYYNSDDVKEAINTLEKASKKADTSYVFPYTRGVIYQKDEQYKKAIEAYELALSRASDGNEYEIYKNMGICYYNIGVEIQQKARKIVNRQAYQDEKEKAAAAFKSAVRAFEKAYEEDPDSHEVITRLNQLYEFMDIEERVTDL